jgi:transcriptional regulator with XRE-family HTH domain
MENIKINKYRLRDLRRERGLTGAELAKALGITQQSISKYESGQGTPSQDKLAKLAAFFNVSTDYLLSLTDVKEPYKKPIKYDEALKILENTKRNNNIIKITDNLSKLDDEKLEILATLSEALTLISNAKKD